MVTDNAQVVELVDTPVLEAGAERRESSSLSLGTKTHEALIITAEECAEVIQQISKIIRFGIDLPYVTAGDGTTNREQLEKEIGDLKCMIAILMEMNIIDNVNVYRAEMAKREKLRKWSNLFNE